MCNFRCAFIPKGKIYFDFYVTAIRTLNKVQNCVTAYRYSRSVLIRELRAVSAM
jgi:hypothetical protein